MEGQEAIGMIWKSNPAQYKEKKSSHKGGQTLERGPRASAGSPSLEICRSPLAKTLTNLHYTYLL